MKVKSSHGAYVFYKFFFLASILDYRIPYYQDAYAPFYNPNGQNENNWLQIGFWKYEHTEHHKEGSKWEFWRLVDIMTNNLWVS